MKKYLCNVVKKTVSRIFFGLILLIFMFSFINGLIYMFNSKFKDSAATILADINFIELIGLSIIFLMIFNTLILTIDLVVSRWSYQIADNLDTALHRFSVPFSILFAMLISLTSEQFQLIATSISFLLIFSFLFPKDFKDLFKQVSYARRKNREENKNKK